MHGDILLAMQACHHTIEGENQKHERTPGQNILTLPLRYDKTWDDNPLNLELVIRRKNYHGFHGVGCIDLENHIKME